jgi:hypothetical protein
MATGGGATGGGATGGSGGAWSSPTTAVGGAAAGGGSAGGSSASGVQATGGAPSTTGTGSGGMIGLGGAFASNGGGGGTAAPSTTSTNSTSGGPTGCSIGHLVIGEVRSRGAGGAADEFVALFNATAAPVALDASWQLSVRGATDATYRSHWTGTGDTIPAFGHYLIAGASYVQAPAPDAALTSGIPDAASLRLLHTGAVVDALCFAYDDTTTGAFDATFTCEGTVASNTPHDNTSSATSDSDVSLARKPGGARGNCADTGDNASDFLSEQPATPEDAASAATP